MSPSLGWKPRATGVAAALPRVAAALPRVRV